MRNAKLGNHLNVPHQYCKTGPTVYRPYPRRLESLTICRCHYKGSTFSSVILRPWLLVRSRFEPATSRTAVRCSTNWANRLTSYHVSSWISLLSKTVTKWIRFDWWKNLLTVITKCERGTKAAVQLKTERRFRLNFSPSRLWTRSLIFKRLLWESKEKCVVRNQNYRRCKI